jgi:hypothetical protein
MKNLQLTLLNSIKLLKARSSRIDKMFPLSLRNFTGTLLPYLAVSTKLSLGRVDRVQERIRMSHNFLIFVQKMYKNHGSNFTIKWLKCCSVALQKYLGGDPLSSLRSLEPNLPLPRLINGCPAFINKRDRQLIRSGNAFIARY